MKPLFFTAVMVIVVLAASNKAPAQNANTTLSNLTSPTKINVDLLPGNTNKHDLGSSTSSWRNVFVQTYYINGSRFIHALGGTSGTPNSNTFVGVSAGNLNASTSGSFNAAVGYQSMLLNNSGNYNTAIGAFSLFHNNSGGYNTASGHAALYNNSTGSGNTGAGEGALYANTGGNFNTATGYSALGANTTGSLCTAMGASALRLNSGNDNSAFGTNSLYYNTTGIENTAVGNYASFSNSTGYYNTAIGSQALINTTTSIMNTAIGFGAGGLLDNGSYNTFLGTYADVFGSAHTNSTSVGFDAQCTASNQVRLGNHDVTSIGGFANWSNVSDVRIKKNIKQNVPGLAFINKLQPITYNLDLDAADRIELRSPRKDKEGKIIQPSHEELDARKAKEQVVYTGLAAQDVEKAAKSLNYDFSGVDAAKNDKDLYGLRYSEFVVPLVKAVQELSKQNDSLKSEIQNLKSDINELKAMANPASSITNNKLQTLNLSSASLEQNIPNPFNQITTINYFLPQQYSSGKIIVTDKSGNVLKEMNISGNGKGTVQIDASTLTSGSYQYSLMVNGKVISTKQMVLIK